LQTKAKVISTVIICKNARSTIKEAIGSALLLTDDVVVIDSGSTDGTIELVAKTPAGLKQVTWNGYGNAKNVGNEIAENDWILSLDSDEYLDDKLIGSLKKADLANQQNVFTFLRLNYLGNKAVHYGAWGNDIVLRLFNRHNASWDTAPVHEELILKSTPNIIKLKGVLHHSTSPDIATYKAKLKKYAALNAEKYYEKNKKASLLKLYLSPVVNFLQNYILKRGFLDGKEGWQIALAHATYTYEKYKLLKAKYNE
jgi:glycosyltransferase involved in cell wall biosynthesis